MKDLDDKSHYFCIKAKVNSNIKIFTYDKKEKHEIYIRFSDLKVWKHKALHYKDIPFGSFQFRCNLLGCTW